MKPTIGLILVLGMILTACEQTPAFDVPPLPSPGPVDASEEHSSTRHIDRTSSPAQEIAIQASKNNLSQRLNINADQISVVNVTEVTWADTSLGCPQPDVAYAQVPTPGYMIQLEANGRIYTYQSDMEGNVVECGESGFPEFPVTPGEIQDGQPWMPVP